jgi:hypothetical protein
MGGGPRVRRPGWIAPGRRRSVVGLVLRRTLGQACASACGLAQDCAARAAEDHRLAVREHRGDCEAPLVSRARGAGRESARQLATGCGPRRGAQTTQVAAHLALHVHEEAVWRLHQPLQLVLPLLIVRRRVQQVQVRRKHLQGGGGSAPGLGPRARRDGQGGQLPALPAGSPVPSAAWGGRTIFGVRCKT